MKLKIKIIFLFIFINLFINNSLFSSDTQTRKLESLKVAVLSDFPPLYIIDKTGKPAGFAIDILNHTAKIVNFKYDYVIVQNWAEAMQFLREKKVDLVPGVGIAEDRLNEFIFSEEMIEVIPVSCFVRAGNHDIKGISDLTGKKTAVMEGSAAFAKMNDWKDYNIISFINIDGALFALLSGDVDAFVFPQPALLKKLRDLNLEDRVKIVGEPLIELKRGYLFRKEDSALKNILDDSLKKITKSDYYKEYYIKWYGAPLPFWTTTRILIIMGTAILITIIVMFGWRYYSIMYINKELEISSDKLKENENIIRKNLIELEKKNAELERFNYTVSHDLKTPLITIKGFIEIIKRDMENNNFEKMEKNFNRIINAVYKMQMLLDDLLQLSKIGKLVNKSESIEFNELLDEIKNLLQSVIKEKNVQIIVDKPLETIFVDKHRIIEILQNLIENAIKYSTPNIQPLINIGWTTEENGFRTYYIKDNGIGINEKYKNKIFDLFEKLNHYTDGSGVGLSIVKRIIELHDGKIWVEANENGGSIFYFSLPFKS